MIAIVHGLLIGLHDEVVSSEGGSSHEHGRLRVVEVNNQAVSQSEVIRREYEFVGPSIELLQHAIRTHSGLCGAQGGHTDSTNMMSVDLRFVDGNAGLGSDDHLF